MGVGTLIRMKDLKGEKKISHKKNALKYLRIYAKCVIYPWLRTELKFQVLLH